MFQAIIMIMQFLGKLMNQTWKNDKKPNFGPDFGTFGRNMDPRKFFCVFYLY